MDAAQRGQVRDVGMAFFHVTGHYGFMQQPEVPVPLRKCADRGLSFDLRRSTLFWSSETIVRGKTPGMARWRAWLFAALARNAQRATAFFGLPPNRVVELGMQIEI